MFTLAISCLTTSSLPWFVDPTFHIPMQYCSLQFYSDFTSINSYIHNWALFSLWLSLFILSGAISPLFSSSILGTHQPEEFIFQCHIFLPFHTVHGLLKAKVLKWLAIPFSSGLHFVRTLHHDPSILGGPAQHGSVSLSKTRLLVSQVLIPNKQLDPKTPTLSLFSKTQTATFKKIF